MIKLQIITIVFIMTVGELKSQTTNSKPWNDHKCAVVLTYDDGLNVHLDNVVPLLDSLEMVATFYINGNSTTLDTRMNEWREVANCGHEIGNHTLFHPCAGKSMGRSWVNAVYDLDIYSMKRFVDEINMANTLLKAIDSKSNRTFAYTCGDNTIDDSSFVNIIRPNFVGARNVSFKFENFQKVDLFNVSAFAVNGNTGDDLIKLVKQAMVSNSLIVFLFHGVGGEHFLNITNADHKELLEFIKMNENDIWTSSMVNILGYIKSHRE